MPYRALLVDDERLARKQLRTMLADFPEVKVVAEAAAVSEALAATQMHRPDVVLMDLRMPEMDGIEATRIIREETPEAKIIALTSYNRDQDICRALEAGVRGYLLKEAVHADVVSAIRTVHAGKRLVPPAVARR